jgi:hypothetical protein
MIWDPSSPARVSVSLFLGGLIRQEFIPDLTESDLFYPTSVVIAGYSSPLLNAYEHFWAVA